MRHGSLLCVVFALAGCPGGDGVIGDRCTDHGDCASYLQCVQDVCVPRCVRAPECGDGYACDKDGLCQVATGRQGDPCASEVDCEAGLACELTGFDSGHLVSSCVQENSGRPAGAECTTDGECRNGTCGLGHCIDLCRDTRDCGTGTACTLIPRIDDPANGAMFAGCLQARGMLRWPIPMRGPSDDHVLLPVPDSARAIAVTFAVEDQNQKVGAVQVTSPDGIVLVRGPASYYIDPVRHRPELGQSVLAMPSSPDVLLQSGAYTLSVTSLRPGLGGDMPGTATPTITAVAKLDGSVVLDLHFYFLNFDDHPCNAAFGGGTLDATIAQSSAFFQNDFLGGLRSLFARGAVTLGTLTYEDLRSHPDLDGLDVANAGALLSLGAHDVGVNVFFVRSLSPVGLQAFGPNPGPAGLAGTRQSGIVIGLDTLCYRKWSDVARLAAHELARYMGLYDNVELDNTQVDPIADSDTSATNLMFYSDRDGTDLSAGQQQILSRSVVLR